MKLNLNAWMVPVIGAVAWGGVLLFAQDEVPVPFDPEDVVEAGGEIDPFDPDGDRPKFVQVQVEYVEMAHETLTELLFLADPPSADATPLRKQVAELIREGEAKVLETSMVVARSGDKATGESIREFIYPMEYEPPEIPNEVDLPDKQGGLTKDDIQGLLMMVTPATPTSFEKRNLGSTLEVSPNIGVDDRTIDLQLAPEIVWHTGNTVWVERKDGLGNVSKVEMPEFYRLSVNTAITCLDGHYSLVAVLSPKDQDGVTDFTRKLMVFVRCVVQVVKEDGE